LAAQELLELEKGFHHLPQDLFLTGRDLVRSSVQLIEGHAQGSRPVQVELAREKFADFGARVNEFLARYLESPSQLQPADCILRFANLWSGFLQALESINEEFFCTFTPSPFGGSLKITCCDASAWLNEGYSAF